MLDGNFPEGVTRVAGLWFSNEEMKLILVLDVVDHTMTVTTFLRGITSGDVLRRRFTPIVE